MASPTPLGYILDRLEREFPDRPVDLQVGARLITLVDEDRARVARSQPEIVRVTRIYIFEGPRDAIEKQIERSLGDGTKILGLSGVKIHVATVGAFPEIVKGETPT